jgi:hypothetical protein
VGEIRIMGRLTLGIQEVADGDGVAALVVDRGILEHLIGVGLGADAHVLLAQMLHMSIDVGAGELLRQRNLLERQLMDACAHRA